MKLERKIFDKVITFSKQSNMSTAEIAKYFNISERMVQRVREAGTWDRWPYIVAKATHGYNTPEYKLYLKRRGLPLTPPPKPIKVYINPKHQDSDYMVFDLQKPEPKRSWWRRLLGL